MQQTHLLFLPECKTTMQAFVLREVLVDPYSHVFALRQATPQSLAYFWGTVWHDAN